MIRSIWIPHSWTSAVLKRSWLKGIRISTDHPAPVTAVAADQTGSHEVSPAKAAFRMTASRFWPEGFTEKV